MLRECVVNLARIKEYVAQNVSGTLDAAGFDNWPELMRGIKAGLLMLGKSRAVEIIEEITQHLKRVMQPGGTALAPDYLDRLADAIVSLEYYIETLQAGRSDPWYMLDNARTCLDALARAPERVLPTVPPYRHSTPARYDAHAACSRRRSARYHRRAHAWSRRCPEPPVLAAAPATLRRSPHTTPDPELIRLFVEEATEEVAKIRQQFPVWDHNPLESEALLIVRRSFHTLKGSGRMVNARALSEFAWAIENLLNRILDGTLQRSPGGARDAARGRRSAAAAGGGARVRQRGRTDVAQLAARAHALASGREPSRSGSSRTRSRAAARGRAHAGTGERHVDADRRRQRQRRHRRPSAPVAAAPVELEPERYRPPAQDDPALREIYARETASHVATVRSWMARERTLGAPHVLPEEIYRACHTLLGSSTMAEARHGMRLAEPLNHWLRKSFDSGVGLDGSDLAAARRLHDGDGEPWPAISMRARVSSCVHDTLRGAHRARRAGAGPTHRRGHATSTHSSSVQSAAAAAGLDATGDAGAARAGPESMRRRRRRPTSIRRSRRSSAKRRSSCWSAAESALAAWNAAPHDSRSGRARCAGRCTRSRAARAWPASSPWASSRTSSRA